MEMKDISNDDDELVASIENAQAIIFDLPNINWLRAKRLYDFCPR